MMRNGGYAGFVLTKSPLGRGRRGKEAHKVRKY